MARMRSVVGCGCALAFAGAAMGQCLTIQDGVLGYSTGSYLNTPLQTGYNDFGYNYQAHMFSGSYFNTYANGSGLAPYDPDGDEQAYLLANPGAENHWAWPYRDVTLTMKWNDAWLSNQDCDGDGKLDRHFGFDSYIGSGAWTTNHQSGAYTYEDDRGRLKKAHWNYFVKIVAVPADATLSGGAWYDVTGDEIGPAIWGSFAIVQEVLNDPHAGAHGVYYLSPHSAGFGHYSPQD